MSQEKQILKYLQEGNSLTPIQALSMFHCFRLSGRIYDLKAKGHNIVRINYKTPTGKYVAKYSMVGQIQLI